MYEENEEIIGIVPLSTQQKVFGRPYFHHDDNNNVINALFHILFHFIVNRHRNERKNQHIFYPYHSAIFAITFLWVTCKALHF